MALIGQQSFFAGMQGPFQRTIRDPLVQAYADTIVPVHSLEYPIRDYAVGGRFQPGAGAVLTWTMPETPGGFVDIFPQMTMESAAGGAAATINAFVRFPGIGSPAGNLDILFSSFTITAGQNIVMITVPKLVIPAGGQLFVTTTAAVAALTDLTLRLARYRVPGPPQKTSVQDITEDIIP